MCSCVGVLVCVCVGVCLRGCVGVLLCVCVGVCLRGCVGVSAWVCVGVGLCAWVCVVVRGCVCVGVCLCAWVCEYPPDAGALAIAHHSVTAQCLGVGLDLLANLFPPGVPGLRFICNTRGSPSHTHTHHITAGSIASQPLAH